MISIRLVAEGFRDEAIMRALIPQIIGHKVFILFKSLKEYHLDGMSLKKKYRFIATSMKVNREFFGIGLFDRDKNKRREGIREVKEALENVEGFNSLFHFAFGEADPHLEAWLLDDPVAIREALGLPPAVQIPSVDSVNDPKEEIEKLRKQGPEDVLEAEICKILEAIAGKLTPKRCTRAKQTGFAQFQKEVHQTFNRVKATCPPDCPCGDACPVDA